MNFLMLAFAVLLPTSSGFLLVSGLWRQDDRSSFFERFFLSYGLGFGLITFGLFVLGVLRIPYTLGPAVFMLVCFMAVILLCLPGSRRPFKSAGALGDRRTFDVTKAISVSEAVIMLSLSLWLCLKMFYVLHEGLIWPVNDWDGLTQWSSGGKFFFYERGLALDPSDENPLGSGYRAVGRYPLHVSLMQVWFSLCLGEAHDVYMKFGGVLYFISMTGLVFFALKRDMSLKIALFAAFFLSSVPLLTYHSFSAYAETTLSYYPLASVVCLWRYFNQTRAEGPEGGAGLLQLAGLFAGFGAWTKMEGIFFIVALGLVLFLFIVFNRLPIRRLFRFFTPGIAINLPWYLLVYIKGINMFLGEEQIINVFRGKEQVISNVMGADPVRQAVVRSPFHFEVLPVVWGQLIFSANFNIVFFFFLVSCVLGFGRIIRTDLKYIVAGLFCVMGMFVLLYITTPAYQWVMDLTAVDRNFLILVPTMYYVSALLAAEMLKGGQ